MNLQKHLRFLLYLLYTALGIAAFALLLPGLLPFLLAFGISCVLEPLVRFLCQRAGLRRPWAAGVVLTGFTVLLVAGCAILLRRLWYELSLLSGKLPILLDSLSTLGSWADDQLYRLAVAVPPSAQQALESALNTALEQIGSLLSELSTRLIQWSTDAVTALPAIVLFLFTTLFACFFMLAGRPALFTFCRKQLPERWLTRLRETTARLRDALASWLRAQTILMGITFALLGAGFLWLRVEPALLLAVGVALLDALPVFGTGTVLFPWAVVELVGGNLRRSAAFLILYAIIWLTRSLLEPKLLAAQSGLHPLAALLAMYLGFSLFGVAGMLLAPLAAMVICQLHNGGVLKIWN